VASGPLAGDTFSISDQTAFPDYDPLAARELLEQAGWSGDPGSPSLELRLVVPNWGSNPEVGQLVAAAWEQLGATVTLEVAAGFGPLTQAQAEGDYHAIGMNSFGTDPDLLRPFFSSDGFFNWTGYRDPLLDQLLAEGMEASPSPERSAAYSELAARVREQWLILPIREYVNLVGVNSRVDGLRFSPQGWFPYLIDLQLRP
jgi:peptide/nickel transport system substrate-binding protein